jgi:membrane protein DedA with SNARE-associated domain
MIESLISHQGLDHLIATYAYPAVALGVGLESTGLPVPGETILVLAAMYATTHADLNIWLVAVAAAVGAIVGDNFGYWLGMRYGYPLLRRFGHCIGLSDKRIKVGQYLFLRHGSKVVSLGRFVALLRMLAAFLAGVNRMRWSDFVLANALGGVVFALSGYMLGAIIFRREGMLAPIAFAIVCVVLFGSGFLMLRFERQLHDKAERALPGP